MSETSNIEVRGEQGLERTPSNLPVWQPAVDILEEPERIVVYAEMPGVGQNQVEVSMENRVLTLRGTPADTDSHEGLLRREFGPRVFERSFTLGDGIDADTIQATMTNGLLKVVLPKKPELAPRKITVRAA